MAALSVGLNRSRRLLTPTGPGVALRTTQCHREQNDGDEQQRKRQRRTVTGDRPGGDVARTTTSATHWPGMTVTCGRGGSVRSSRSSNPQSSSVGPPAGSTVVVVSVAPIPSPTGGYASRGTGGRSSPANNAAAVPSSVQVPSASLSAAVDGDHPSVRASVPTRDARTGPTV